MSNRELLNDEMLETVSGGNITFTWRYQKGTCGLNGDYSYSFTNRSAFLAKIKECYGQGMNDAETLSALLSAGIITLGTGDAN